MAIRDGYLRFPIKGLNDNQPYSEQPQQTTGSCVNVRAIDPKTGRTRGGQRPGTAAITSATINGANPVRNIQQVTYQQKTVTYSDPSALLNDSTDDIGTYKTPTGKPCRMGVVDIQNNVYALDGPSAVVKLNSEFTELVRVSLPVQDPDHEVRALAVDEASAIYAGTSGEARVESSEDGNGVVIGDPEQARLWKYRLLPDNEYELAWELPNPDAIPEEELGGFVQDIHVEGGVMFVLLNDPRSYKAHLVRYESIDSAVPQEVWRRSDIPYPASAVDVNDAGDLLVCWESFLLRGTDPSNPGADTVITGWDPHKDLSKDHVWWCEFDLRDPGCAVTTGGNQPQEGDEVLRLNDLTGNGRHAYAAFDSAASEAPPLYVENALSGLPGVRFGPRKGVGPLGTTTLHGVMRSLGNPGVDIAFRDGQKTLFPMYHDEDDDERASMFACFMVLRPAKKGSDSTPPVAADIAPVVVQKSDASVAGVDLGVYLHQAGAGGDTVTGSPTTGAIRVIDEDESTKPGDAVGGGGQPLEGKFTKDDGEDAAVGSAQYVNDRNAVVITWIHDNGVDSGDSASKTRSIWRVNGIPLDRWQSLKTYSTEPTELGVNSLGNDALATQFADYDLCYFAVLDRQDPDSANEPKIITHPVQPDSPASFSSGKLGRILLTGAGSGYTNGTYSVGITGGGGTGATAQYVVEGNIVTEVRVTAPGSGYTSAPTLTFTDGSPSSNATGVAGMYDISSPTDVEKFESYLMWGFGMNTLLTNSTEQYVMNQVDVDQSGSTPNHVPTVMYQHPYVLTPAENASTVDIYKFGRVTEGLAKFSGDGSVLQAVISGPGLGHGVKVDAADSDYIYTVGQASPNVSPSDPDSLGAAVLRRIKDEGTSLDHTADSGTYQDDFGINDINKTTYRMDVDGKGHVYLPMSAATDTADAFSFVVVKSNGAGGSQIITEYSVDAGLVTNQPFYAIAVPRKLEDGKSVPSLPEYGSDLTDDVAEHVWVFGSNALYNGTGTSNIIRKVRLVSSAPNTNAPRATKSLAVSNGALDSFTVGGAPVTIDASAFDANARAVFSTVLFQKVYYVDGEVYKVYDPIAGTLTDWKSTSAGEIPARARLIETWNDRIVLGRFADDPQLWAMSAKDDPDNWDQFPPVVLATQSIQGGNPVSPGRAPDIVNCLFAVADDLLVMGGDKSVFRFSGDPMAGGQIDRVPVETGIAFGRPICMDDRGNIWFLGSRGGLWIMDAAATSAREITDYTASRELQALDFTNFHYQLAYDYRHEGIWIVQCPFGAGGTVKTHWFYDTKNGGLWPDSYAASGIQPTCLGVLDSDAETDRIVAFGREDGFVAKWHEDERGDDTGDSNAAVNAQVLLGPFKSPVPGRMVRMVDVNVTLADDESGCLLKVYASNSADSPGAAKETLSLKPGRNDNVKARAVGSYIWLELVQSGVGQRFSVEEATFRYTIVGRQRELVI